MSTDPQKQKFNIKYGNTNMLENIDIDDTVTLTVTTMYINGEEQPTNRNVIVESTNKDGKSTGTSNMVIKTNGGGNDIINGIALNNNNEQKKNNLIAGGTKIHKQPTKKHTHKRRRNTRRRETNK